MPIRLKSADVYRGLVMLLMMAEVLQLHAVAAALPTSGFWKFMAFHQSHVEWVGCSLHDLIQPSFSFLVGVVLPFSLYNRKTSGQTYGHLVRHAAWRSVILIFLGIFLRSIGEKQTNYTFEDTLTQIGLGYTFLFMLGFQSVRVQWLVLIVILVSYWLAFAAYPIPTNFNYERVFVPTDWPHLATGFEAHWNKNSNLAWAFDTWFLNLFPRETPFIANGGGYVTLSFIPTLATMILGLLAGNILISNKLPTEKRNKLLLFGLAGIALGLVFHYAGICPNVKRIWTPTWVLFSGGWCFLLMAFFYHIIDIRNNADKAYFLLVIGTNSIAAYVMAHTVDRFISSALLTHLGANYATLFGVPYQTLVHGSLILLFEWLILRWMYRKKIFIKI